jgi:hypothetical protein
LKKPIKTSKLYADVLADEYDAKEDWRYSLLLPYIRSSPSHLAVRDRERGLKVPKSAIPKDHKLVYKVAHWFDLLSVAADEYTVEEWWENVGKSLYGVYKGFPVIAWDCSAPDNLQTYTDVGSSGLPTLNLFIPLTLSSQDALSQIKRLLKHLQSRGRVQFNQDYPDDRKPYYQLEKSRLTEDTLLNGLKALELYKNGMQLWEIGDLLNLSPINAIKNNSNATYSLTERKISLAAMTRRLITIASHVAENAARGRFPSAKPFPEAMLGDFKRKAGRPRSQSN